MSTGDNILVIDPDDSIRILLGEYLSNRGYRVFTAAGKTEAQSILLDQPVSVALIDSGFDGATSEIVEYLRSDYRQTRILLMTGQPTLKTVIDAFRNGVFDFIIKPFCLDDLGDVLQRAFAEGRRGNSVSELQSRVRILEAELQRHGLPLPEKARTLSSGSDDKRGKTEERERHHLQFQARTDETDHS